jgi:hypothetical protein
MYFKSLISILKLAILVSSHMPAHWKTWDTIQSVPKEINKDQNLLRSLKWLRMKNQEFLFLNPRRDLYQNVNSKLIKSQFSGANVLIFNIQLSILMMTVLINLASKLLRLVIIGNLLVPKRIIANYKLIGGPLTSGLGKKKVMKQNQKIKTFKH